MFAWLMAFYNTQTVVFEFGAFLMGFLFVSKHKRIAPLSALLRGFKSKSDLIVSLFLYKRVFI